MKFVAITLFLSFAAVQHVEAIHINVGASTNEGKWCILGVCVNKEGQESPHAQPPVPEFDNPTAPKQVQPAAQPPPFKPGPVFGNPMATGGFPTRKDAIWGNSGGKEVQEYAGLSGNQAAAKALADAQAAYGGSQSDALQAASQAAAQSAATEEQMRQQQAYDEQLEAQRRREEEYRRAEEARQARLERMSKTADKREAQRQRAEAYDQQQRDERQRIVEEQREALRAEMKRIEDARVEKERRDAEKKAEYERAYAEEQDRKRNERAIMEAEAERLAKDSKLNDPKAAAVWGHGEQPHDQKAEEEQRRVEEMNKRAAEQAQKEAEEEYRYKNAKWEQARADAEAKASGCQCSFPCWTKNDGSACYAHCCLNVR